MTSVQVLTRTRTDVRLLFEMPANFETSLACELARTKPQRTKKFLPSISVCSGGWDGTLTASMLAVMSSRCCSDVMMGIWWDLAGKRQFWVGYCSARQESHLAHDATDLRHCLLDVLDRASAHVGKLLADLAQERSHTNGPVLDSLVSIELGQSSIRQNYILDLWPSSVLTGSLCEGHQGPRGHSV